MLGAARSLPTLSRPAGLAVGARGNVYVSDTGNHRIVEIAPDGRLLAHFGDADLGPQGASGLAVSAGGTVYVADTFHRAIRVYSPGHRRIASWPVAIPGASGTALAVAVGGGGTVIVAAAPESRCTIPYGPPTCATSYIVQRRASSGRVLGQFRTIRSHPSARPNAIVTQLSVAVNPAGDIYVAAGGTEPCYKDCRVYHFLIEHAAGRTGARDTGARTSWTRRQTGRRWPPAAAVISSSPTTSASASRSERPEGASSHAGPSERSSPLRWSAARSRSPSGRHCQVCPGPAGVAVARNGTVYVSDPGSGRILVLSSGGRLLAQWGAGGTAPGRFWFPASVALDAQGQLWVDDMANGRVQIARPPTAASTSASRCRIPARGWRSIGRETSTSGNNWAAWTGRRHQQVLAVRDAARALGQPQSRRSAERHRRRAQRGCRRGRRVSLHDPKPARR